MAKKAGTKNTKVAKVAKTAKAGKAVKVVKAKKEKKVKDPNAPKRACSAFILYSCARRAGIMKEQPSLNHKEVISAISKEWNVLGAAEKEVYNKQAEAEKARYTREMAAYKKK